MRITFLGTGTAFQSDGRAAQCILFEPAGAGAFLVDVGPTALAAARRLRVDLDPVEHVFITHLHGDHTAGWPFLLLSFAFERQRTSPLTVHGPAGVGDTLSALARLCYPELAEPGRLPFAVVFDERPVGAARALPVAAGLVYDTVPMDHHPTSLGYRFVTDTRRIGVSGDTRWCEGLEQLAAGCDLLLLECSSVATGAHAHVALEEIRTRRQRLGAERVVLVHLTDAVAAELARDPIPGVDAAYDGMALELA